VRWNNERLDASRVAAELGRVCVNVFHRPAHKFLNKYKSNWIRERRIMTIGFYLFIFFTCSSYIPIIIYHSDVSAAVCKWEYYTVAAAVTAAA